VLRKWVLNMDAGYMGSPTSCMIQLIYHRRQIPIHASYMVSMRVIFLVLFGDSQQIL